MGCLKITYLGTNWKMHALHERKGTYSREQKSVQSWLSVDPLAELMPEWSSYSYTFNNPVNFTDPTGMIPNGGGGCEGDDCDPPDQEGGTLGEVIVLAPKKEEQPKPNSQSESGNNWTTESHESDFGGSMDAWKSLTGMDPSDYTTADAVAYNEWYIESVKRERLKAFLLRFKFFFIDMGTLETYQYAIGAGGVSALAKSTRAFNPNFGLVGSKSSSSISKINTSIRVDKNGIERWSKHYANGRFAPGNNTRVIRDHYDRGFNQHYGLNGLGQANYSSLPAVHKNYKGLKQGSTVIGLSTLGGLTAWSIYEREKNK